MKDRPRSLKLSNPPEGVEEVLSIRFFTCLETKFTNDLSELSEPEYSFSPPCVVRSRAIAERLFTVSTKIFIVSRSELLSSFIDIEAFVLVVLFRLSVTPGMTSSRLLVLRFTVSPLYTISESTAVVPVENENGSDAADVEIE